MFDVRLNRRESERRAVPWAVIYLLYLYLGPTAWGYDGEHIPSH